MFVVFFVGTSNSILIHVTKDVNYKASKLMAHTYKTYKEVRWDV